MATKTLSFRARLVVYFTTTILLLTACFFALVTYFAEQSLHQQLQRTRTSIDKALQVEIANREKTLEQYVDGLRSNVRFQAALEELDLSDDVDLLRQTLISNYRPSDFASPPTLLAIADLKGVIRVRFIAPEDTGSYELKKLSGTQLYEFLEEHTSVIENNEPLESVLSRQTAQQVTAEAVKAYLDMAGSEICLVVAKKLVFDNNDTAGVVVMGSPLDDVFIESFKKPLNPEDQIILAKSDSVIHSTSLAFADILTANKGESSRIEYQGLTYGSLTVPLTPAYGVDRQLAKRPPYLTFALNFSNEIQSQRRLLNLILIIGLLGVLASLLTAYFLARSISEPIKKLVTGTKELVNGEYPVHVSIDSQDEIGLLADSFNEMSKGLELKDRYRDLMDMVVSPQIAEELRNQEEAGTLNLGGDRQQVTILFADVRGFTPLTQELPPEEILDLLNEYFEIASSIIEKYGGVIDKYIGDEVMSLFGAPLARADDAERALQAALALRNAIANLSKEREALGKPSLLIGIGLASGEVVAGLMGSRKRLSYSVIGPAVNLAARLCGAAAPLEVLVSEELTATDLQYTFEKKAGLSLKGISSEVSIFKAEAATP